MTTLLINPRPRHLQPRLARIAAAVLSATVFSCLCQQAEAQRYIANADPDSAEGQFIELINLQSDDAQKLALLEQFAQRFPKHQAISWAYEQLQLSAFEAGKWIVDELKKKVPIWKRPRFKVESLRRAPQSEAATAK